MPYVISHGLAALVWFALAASAMLFGGRRRRALAFALACALQAGWAVQGLVGLPDPILGVLLESGRMVAWGAFLALLLPRHQGRVLHLVLLAGGILVAVRAGLPYLDAFAEVTRIQAALICELLAVTLALCVTVAVFSASAESSRWSLKFLCFPLAGLFVYDLFLYSQMLSIGLSSLEYLQARVVLAVLSAPFVVIAAWRSGFWAQELQLSRQAALYSVALVAVGLYLLAVAGATLLVRSWSIGVAPMLQVGLLFASALLLLFLLFSGRFRARLKLWVSRHFYAGKYDYAHEWRKFMQTLALEDESNALENRIIRACANLLEVPGGALWVMEGGRPRLHATWNYRPVRSAVDEVPDALFRDRDGRYQPLHGAGLAGAAFARDDSEAWLAVPLPHAGRLLGFIVLSPPRVSRPIDAEDSELVMLIAYQCASYLAEKRAVTALENEKQFARFNRQYAFVAHDIKNLVSQLAVMLKNFDRHAENPAFQQDMRETVSHAVSRMRALLDRLSRLRERSDTREEDADPVDVPALVESVLSRHRDASRPRIELVVSAAARGRKVRAASERLADVLDHLLTNAREAGGEAGRVQVDLDVVDDCVVVDVTDNGPGMEPEFVRDVLFTPFRSTKEHGFGVGVYQCREFAREHGGELEAISSPGSGTTMRLRLPLASRNSRSNGDGTESDEKARAVAGR